MKLNEVLLRFNGIAAPKALGLPTCVRDDAALEASRAARGILRGKKVFSTDTTRDRPWRMDHLEQMLNRAGFVCVDVHVELRKKHGADSLKPVLTLQYVLGGQNGTISVETKDWLRGILSQPFQAVMIHRNPRTDRTCQLAVDSNKVEQLVPGLPHLPLERFLSEQASALGS